MTSYSPLLIIEVTAGYELEPREVDALKERSKLAEIRIAKGLLQKDVARAAGVTRAFYTQVENGTRVPSLKAAKAMANILGVSLDDFFDALGVTEWNSNAEYEQAATTEAVNQ